MADAVRDRLETARLYLCTDARRRQGDFAEFVAAAVAGGVDIVQLREKGLEAGVELELLQQLGEIVRAAGALLAVNDRADLAAVAHADVLHLGQDDLTPQQARRIVGPGPVIGRSTHDIGQGRTADADADVDYFCVGPVWATPTKPGRPAAGLGAVEAAGGNARTPWFAIGGIDSPDRLQQVLDAGATRIVVVRAITEADDPQAAARALRSRLPA